MDCWFDPKMRRRRRYRRVPLSARTWYASATNVRETRGETNCGALSCKANRAHTRQSRVRERRLLDERDVRGREESGRASASVRVFGCPGG